MTKKSEKYHLQFIKLLDDMKAVNNNQRRQNKKGGGVRKEKKKHKHKTYWILPYNQFKTNLSFLVFWAGGTLFSLDLGPDLKFDSKT